MQQFIIELLQPGNPMVQHIVSLVEINQPAKWSMVDLQQTFASCQVGMEVFYKRNNGQKLHFLVQYACCDLLSIELV